MKHELVRAHFPAVVPLTWLLALFQFSPCFAVWPNGSISSAVADPAARGASAGAVTVETEAGQAVAAAFGKNRAALHQNHGLLTASRHSIDDAAFWFIALERCCQVQLLVEASGVKPQIVPEKSARYSREHVGNDFIGWLHFQPMFDLIAKTQPDMFD